MRILDAWGNTTRTSAGVSLAIEENGGPGGILSGTTVVTAREGIATFPDVKIDKAGTDYTLEASARLSPSQTLQRTSAAFDITVGQPAKLVFSTPPPASARAGTLFRTVVEVRDAGVNRVPVDGKPISITLQAPAGGTLAGTTTVETTAGQAAFDLSIATPGTGYRLCADAEGMTQAISAPFNVTPGAPARLLFRSQPQDGVAGIALAPAINVVVADAAGNVMTSAAYTITLSLTGGDSPATVAAPGNRAAAVMGVATFGNVTVSKASRAKYRLVASCGTLAGATSDEFTISPGAPTELVFAQQPTNGVANTPLAPPVQVALRDACGNTTWQDGIEVRLALQPHPQPGATLLNGFARTAAGVAVYRNLKIRWASTRYQIRAAAAVSPALTLQKVSAPFDIVAGAAANLAFAVPPLSTRVGAPIRAVVEVRDASGNRVPVDGKRVTVALRAPAGGGTLGGTTAIDTTDGRAAFTVSIDRPGTGYQLLADAEGLTQAVSSPFTVTVAPARLVFQTQPQLWQTAGEPLAPAIRVALVDAGGAVVTTATDTVTLSLTGGDPAGTVEEAGGTAAAVRGVATFTNAVIRKACLTARYRLVSSSGALTQATSGEFSVGPARPAEVSFLQQPTDTGANQYITPAVAVAVLDAYGNRTLASQVAIAIENNAGPGAALANAEVVWEQNGVYTFPLLRIDKPGSGYTLKATVGDGPLCGTSAGFSITAPPAGPPARLAFLSQPSAVTAGRPQPEVLVGVLDADGNVVRTGADTVTLSLSGGSAGATIEAPGNTAAAAQGVASFTGVRVNKAGTGYRLVASSGTLAPATSDAFEVRAGARARLGFAQHPTDVTVNRSIVPAVRVAWQDEFGNLTEENEPISLELVSDIAGARLAGGGSVAPIHGVATFAAVRIDRVGTYRLRANATASPGPAGSAPVPFRVESQEFRVGPGVAKSLAFAVPPASTGAGRPIRPVVAVVDGAGNRVSVEGKAVTVTLIRPSGGGAMAGQAVVNTTTGEAAFDLSIVKVAAGYQLRASAEGLMPVTSAPFSITPGVPAGLVFLQQPSDVASNQYISPSVRVRLRDAHGNACQDGGQAVTLTLEKGATSDAKLLGGSANTVAGVAEFRYLRVNLAGTGYKLTAMAACKSGTLSATSAAFDVTAGTAARLVFTTPPYTTRAGSTILPVVQVQDAAGNRVLTSKVSVRVTLRTATGGGALTGSNPILTTAGQVTFRLSASTAATGCQLIASATGLQTAVSPPFEITQAPVAGLTFLSQPTDTRAGEAVPEFRVGVVDSGGHLVTMATNTIALRVLAMGDAHIEPPGDTATASGGIAAFRGVRIQAASPYTYRLEASLGPGMRPAVSSPFRITPGAPARLAFVQQPTNTVSNVPMNPRPSVAAFDSLGNVCYDQTAHVALTIENNPAGGTLSFHSIHSNWQGVTTFGGPQIDKAGAGYTFRAAVPSLGLSQVSAPFNITAGPADHLAFTLQPSAGPVGSHFRAEVEVQDAAGNLVPVNGIDLTAAATDPILPAGWGAIAHRPRIVWCNTRTSGGRAVLDAVLTGSGSWVFRAYGPGLSEVKSNEFNVIAAPALEFVAEYQNFYATAGSPVTVVVRMWDLWGRAAVPSQPTTVTLTLNPGGVVLGQQTTSDDAVITFRPTVTRAGGHELVVSAPGMSSDTCLLSVRPSDIAYMEFTRQPRDTDAGQPIPVQVTVYDRFGNVAPKDQAEVELAAYDEDDSPVGGEGPVSSAIVNIGGVADFPYYRLGPGEDYYLVATLVNPCIEVGPIRLYLKCISQRFDVYE